MSFQLDKTIKAGDILTSLTIAISVIALLLSLAKDRNSRTVDQANKIRTAAASAIINLDRWQSVQVSMFQELQPTFVELSEGLAQKYDVIGVRDKFWRQVNAERTRIARQVLQEQLGTAYLDILAHFPAARTQYADSFAQLATVEDEVSNAFLAASEQAILSLKGKKVTYQTAHLGNALRAEALKSVSDLKARSETVIAPVRKYLLSVIALPDDEIVTRAAQDRLVTHVPERHPTQ